MVAFNMNKPDGCFDCDFLIRYYFDGDEYHYICPYLKREVSDDGERDEECPYVDEISDKEYQHIQAYRILEPKRQKLKNSTVCDEISTPSCTEDGEWFVGCEPESYWAESGCHLELNEDLFNGK